MPSRTQRKANGKARRTTRKARRGDAVRGVIKKIKRAANGRSKKVKF